MQKIYYKSDLKIFINLGELDGGDISPFEFRYFTNDPTNFVSCSWDGKNFTNCEKTQGGVIARWNKPNLYPGQLKVLRAYRQADEKFDDGVFNYVSASTTTIIISDEYATGAESTQAISSSELSQSSEVILTTDVSEPQDVAQDFLLVPVMTTQILRAANVNYDGVLSSTINEEHLSITNPITGIYKIIHNIGHTNYWVSALPNINLNNVTSPHDISGASMQYSNKTANSIDVTVHRAVDNRLISNNFELLIFGIS